LALAKTYQQIAWFLARIDFRSKERQTVVLALIAAASFFGIAMAEK
jgi:hypothetical protein